MKNEKSSMNTIICNLFVKLKQFMEKTINKKILGIFLWAIFIFFAWFIAINEYVLLSWEKVYLKTIPVDPRDFLRWDYVILRYEIEQDKQTKDFIKSSELKKWDIVYFQINKDENNLWTLENISFNKPENNKLYIKWVYNDPESLRNTPFDLWVWKFFVPEWRWREVERIISWIEVLVSVEKSWIAKVVDLYYKWEKIDFKKEKLFE